MGHQTQKEFFNRLNPFKIASIPPKKYALDHLKHKKSIYIANLDSSLNGDKEFNKVHSDANLQLLSTLIFSFFFVFLKIQLALPRCDLLEFQPKDSHLLFHHPPINRINTTSPNKTTFSPLMTNTPLGISLNSCSTNILSTVSCKTRLAE